MLALSVRQPWAGLIVAGAKVEEYRSRPTRVRSRVYVYAAKGGPPCGDEDEDALVLRDGRYYLVDLRRGLLLGTVEVYGCVPAGDGFAWLLRNARPLAKPIRPARPPAPAWFKPF